MVHWIDESFYFPFTEQQYVIQNVFTSSKDKMFP